MYFEYWYGNSWHLEIQTCINKFAMIWWEQTWLDWAYRQKVGFVIMDLGVYWMVWRVGKFMTFNQLKAFDVIPEKQKTFYYTCLVITRGRYTPYFYGKIFIQTQLIFISWAENEKKRFK